MTAPATIATRASNAASTAALRAFRAGFHRCLTGWADAAFELTDAVACAPTPVCSIPALSLEPVFRRSHGSLYKALARGGIDPAAARDLLRDHRPQDWPEVRWLGHGRAELPANPYDVARLEARPSLAIARKRRRCMPIRGPLPDVEIPQVSLYEFLFGGLSDADADRVGVIRASTGEEFSFRRLRHDVDHVAAWFAAHGVGAGDAVLVMLPNCPEYVTAFHGVARAGAAASPVNTQYTSWEIAHQLRTTGAQWVIVEAGLTGAVAAALEVVGLGPDRMIVVGEASGPDAGEAGEAGNGAARTTDHQDTTDYRELTSYQGSPPADPVTDPARHVAALPMSSGLGGLQKAVMLTHRNLVANVAQFNPVLAPLGIGHCLVAFLPFSHVYALTDSMHYALANRFPLVTMAVFDPVHYLEAISRYKATLLYVVPPVAGLLARHPVVDEYDVSSVEVIISGASSLDQKIGERLAARMNARVLQGYGMTETSPVTHVMHPDQPDVRFETIGPALPNVTFRVVDVKTGQDVEVPATGESEPGELWCSGPNVMLGYYNEPDATARIIDADGYLHTGDLVRVDARGIVRIVGRTKELIKNRGFQVPPAELEAVLATHPAVADAGVYGTALPNGSGDEVPHAIVQLADGLPVDAASPAELRTYLAQRTAGFKHVRSVTIVDRVPRSPEGDLLRRALPLLAAKAKAAAKQASGAR